MTRQPGRTMSILSAVMREVSRKPEPPAEPGGGIIIDILPESASGERPGATPRPEEAARTKKSTLERLLDLRDLAAAAQDVSKRFVDLHDEVREAGGRLKGKGQALRDSVAEAIPADTARTLKEWQGRAADLTAKARAAMAPLRPDQPSSEEIALFATLAAPVRIVTASGAAATIEAGDPALAAGMALAMLPVPETPPEASRFLRVVMQLRLRDPEAWPVFEGVAALARAESGAPRERGLAVVPLARPEMDERNRMQVTCLVDSAIMDTDKGPDARALSQLLWADIAERLSDHEDAMGNSAVTLERVLIGTASWPPARAKA